MQILTSDNSLCHKDSSKSFPVGAFPVIQSIQVLGIKIMLPTGTPLPILKWKSGASADHVVPIKVVRTFTPPVLWCVAPHAPLQSCWPSSGANSSTMTIEYFTHCAALD